MDGIEKCFYVHLAVAAVRIRQHLYATARNHFAVEGIRIDFCAVVEPELLADFADGCVQKHVLTVENYHRVDHIFKVFHLVGGNHDR